jgi:hypothetical protein
MPGKTRRRMRGGNKEYQELIRQIQGAKQSIPSYESQMLTLQDQINSTYNESQRSQFQTQYHRMETTLLEIKRTLPQNERKLKQMEEQTGGIRIVTYTPRYHEVEHVINHPGKSIQFEVKNTVHEPITKYNVSLVFPKTMKEEEIKQWYPVYICSYMNPSLGYSPHHSGTTWSLILIDCCGILHRINTQHATTNSIYIRYVKQLPDSFIDFVIHDFTNKPETFQFAVTEMGGQSGTRTGERRFPPESTVPLKKVPVPTPYRKFEATHELANYIESLENKAYGKKNAELQTNMPRESMSVQTNLIAPLGENIVLGSNQKPWAEPAGRNYNNIYLTSVKVKQPEKEVVIENV